MKHQKLGGGGSGLQDMRTRGLIDLHLASSPYNPDAPIP